MNFENGPIQQIFNSKGENSSISFNQWEQEGDFSIKEDNNFLRNTCKASNINVAEVSGEIPTAGNRCSVWSRLGWNQIMQVFDAVRLTVGWYLVLRVLDTVG